MNFLRAPDLSIGGSENPYLERWFLIPRNRYCNIYLHRFLRDDDDRACHDHPWRSLSILLKGSLTEIYLDNGIEKRRDIGLLDITYRPPELAHRLIVKKRGTLTLFITGPKMRPWGFHCPQGWKHWKDFTGFNRTGDSTRIGPGCGE